MEHEDYPNYIIHKDGKIIQKSKDRELPQYEDKYGYMRVNLWINGRHKTERVHRMLGKAYLPNPENKRTIDHIDRNKNNNHLSNLRWCCDFEQSFNRKDFERDETKTPAKYVSINNSGRGRDRYIIAFQRNKKRYQKILPIDTPFTKVIEQRDLMLSMFA